MDSANIYSGDWVGLINNVAASNVRWYTVEKFLHFKMHLAAFAASVSLRGTQATTRQSKGLISCLGYNSFMLLSLTVTKLLPLTACTVLQSTQRCCSTWRLSQSFIGGFSRPRVEPLS